MPMLQATAPMGTALLLLLLPAVVQCAAAAAKDFPAYESRTYNQTLDHFDPSSDQRW